MMEQGQLIASEVLPKVGDEFRRAARDGGAYKKALEGLRVTEGQFSTEVQRSADTIFKSGFEKGLSELYKELSTQLKGTTSSQKDLGNIYNKFFKLITLGIKVVTPLLESLVQIVSFSVDGFYETAKGIGTATDNLKTMSPALYDAAKAVGVLAFAFNTLLGKVLVVFGALQEIVSLFNDDLVGKLEQQMGKQINLKTMRQEVIVETKEGIFSGEDYGVNVNLKVDKDLKSFEDINKFLEDNNLTATGFAESMGMKVADLKTSVENGLSDSIKTALKTYTLDENMKEQAEKLGGSFEELITSVEDGALSLKEFSSVVRGISNSVADSDGVIAAVSSLSLELVLAVAALVSFKKGLGSIAEKIFGIKSPDKAVKNTSKSGGYMKELLAFLTNPTTIASGALAAPVLYSAAKMSEDPTASLESIKESGLYSGRFNQANRFMEAQQRQQLQNSVNQTINLSGFEIPITITNPSDLDEVRRAGQAAGEGFLTTLELSNLLKGGR